jgi:molybdenum cofactor cytidylyltransferase
MGRPKLLLPFDGGTVLGATLAVVTASAVDRVVVVTGASAEAVEASIGDDVRVSVVRNADHRRGNMSSLLVGTASDPDAEAFVQVPGDMPTMPRSAIDALVDRWHAASPWAAVTAYRDRIAHPFLLSRAAIEEGAHLEGSKVLWRALVESGDERVARVSMDFDAPLDVNTPDDYESLVQRSARRRRT